ncbi:MAG: folylpolyglutamate synthase/dihydrofolate synthase family protein [Candidatus Aenigmatarchaeota archaeon]
MLDYNQVVEYIFNMRRFGDIKLGLDRISYMLESIGNPEKKLKIIHVGGTAGKGSTVMMISSILQAAGFKVGSYTSPHLSSYTERIVINGERIKEEEIISMFEKLKPIIDDLIKRKSQPTFFEVTAVMAFKYFFDKKVDFAVIEVGMGGRLDATNVVHPLVSIITNIGLEHTEYLGNSLEEIAREKAGIIKNFGILVTAVDDEKIFNIIKDVAKEKNSRILRLGNQFRFKKINSNLDGQTFDVIGENYEIKELFTSLLGDFQLTNAATAVAAIKSLKSYGTDIPEKAYVAGFKNVRWPGRMEIIQKDPLVILDSAKDPLAMSKLVESLKSLLPEKKVNLVFAVSRDKKVGMMLREIIPMSNKIVLTRHSLKERSMDPASLAEEVEIYGKEFTVAENVNEAVERAINGCGKDEFVLVTGSVFTVGEARERWFKEVDLRWGRELNEKSV